MLVPILTLALAPLAAPAAQESGRAIVTRQDLAAAVQEVDALLAARLPGGDLADPADADFLREANRRFDRLSVQFFAGGLSRAHEELAAWAEELSGEPYQRSPLRIDFEEGRGFTPRGLMTEGETAQVVRLRAIAPIEGRAGTAVSAAVRVTSGSEVLASVPVELRFDDRGLLVPQEVSVEPARDGAPAWRVRLVEVADGEDTVLAEAELRTAPVFARLRERIEAQLEAGAFEDPSAARVLRERAALLDDTPSPRVSRDFVLATDALARAVEAEAAALLRGEDPYRNAPGDLWRTVAHGRRDLPLRVYRPPGFDGPLPLVVALHGAGGDENFLFELAGDGFVKRLADEHGFVVACPRTFDVAGNMGAFDALVAELRADYDLTPEAPLLFGHSMGGGAVSALLTLRPDAIRRAVCFAGFSGVRPDAPPTLVIAAEFDGLVRAAGLRRSARAAATGGAPVTFEVLANQGHTLGLTEALQRAVAFWGIGDD